MNAPNQPALFEDSSAICDHSCRVVTRYRKKPVEIEAMQLIGAAGDTTQVLDWMASNSYPMLVGDYTSPETLRYHDQAPGDDSHPDKGTYIDPATGDFMIRTLEGDMRAIYGDYIIRGVQGEFYPCKPDIFEATYDRLTALHEIEQAVTELDPAPVKPRREDVARAIWDCTDLNRAIYEYCDDIAEAILALFDGKTEQKVRADVLDWAAEHLSDGLKYEDIEQINSWEAVTVCAGVIRKKAQETRGGER